MSLLNIKPNIKYAFLVVKPDALKKTLDINIINGLENFGLEIVKRKFTVLTRDQAANLYEEKSHYNYFPILLNFMTGNQTLCLILKSANGNATEEAKKYRDWARHNLREKKYELTGEDLKLLNLGIHPLQGDITKVMALENLIHVSDNFNGQEKLIKSLFNKWEIEELKDREPFLYNTFSELNRPFVETKLEISSIMNTEKR